MDFAKAFDKVPHRRVLHKLDSYGTRWSIHRWINSWLSGRAQQIVLHDQAYLKSSSSIIRCAPGIGSVVVDSLLIVAPNVGFCSCSMFCYALLLCIYSSFASTFWKRELVALLSFSSWCLVIVVLLFIPVP